MASFESNQVRDLLIGAIAGTYEAATNLEGNCWGVNSVKVCHVPVQVSVFTAGLTFPTHSARPTILTHWCADSYMSAMVFGDGEVDNYFHCCETRSYVDAKLDTLHDELKSVYPASRSKDRNVQCLDTC